ncbi:cardiolipin synthase [Spongiimicrobium salis]|uniref:cardiolipin synthase n=1 Tax=Spongiimicrobium salis TaxID=1667022 RepID=UPI00374DE5CC
MNWTVFLLILYVVLAIVVVFGLLINGVRPSKTLAWLLAIFTIPIGGILFYLLLGRNRRKNRLLKNRTYLNTATLAAPLCTEYGKLQQLILKNCHFPPTYNNDLKILKDGKTTFESIFDALETAQSYIYIQYYIFEEGELANRLLRVFREKIAHGVQVKMIYDSIGSYSLSKKYLKELRKMGVQVFPFLPFRFGRFLSSLNNRNHRKIIVIDGIIGFTGGINISDKYLKGDPNLGHWHDRHLEIEGEAVEQLETTFILDWNLVSEQKLSFSKRKTHPLYGDATVQIASSGPEDDFPTIEQVYFSIINNAKSYLYIINPYIIPGPEILQALQTASLSGVDIRISISPQSDSTIVGWSVQSYFEPLLKAGVRIFLFPHGFLHSKIMISDDRISAIGTANIDIRSFEHNYEVNAIVYDEATTIELKEDFLADCIISRELLYAEHKKRALTTKLKEGFAKILSPVL